MTSYVAVLTPDAKGYRVLFPDLPKCHAAGADMAAALQAADFALQQAMAAFEAAAEPLPPARPIDEIKEDRRWHGAAEVDWTRASFAEIGVGGDADMLGRIPVRNARPSNGE